jgi:replicative DNA helicase
LVYIAQSNNTNKTIQLSAFEEEILKANKKVSEYKKACEANIVSILWKMPDLYYTYDNLTLNNFSENCWRVYWQIGYDIILKEKKQNLDDVTVGLYLEKHLKLKAAYEKYKGYETIENAKEYVKVNNMEGYIDELHKWNVVLDLLKRKFPVYDRIKDFADMTSEEIYDEYEAMLNHIFANVEGDDITHDITDGLKELIEELDAGMAVGLPLDNSPMLTKEIGGDLEGNITLVGGLSGVGKTALSRTLKLPSIIKHNTQIVIMINEEGKKKWQREYLVWIANNIFKEDLQKYIVRDGKYKKEVKELLHKCSEWAEQYKNTIIIKPFTQYTTAKAIKTIKKYASMGVKYFMLDTYKADSKTTNSEAFWFNMQQNMVEINDVIKPESKNVHIWITFQLSKGSSKQRYYGQDNIGMAKNIVDVASTCLMIRQVFDDEYETGKHELYVYRKEKRNGNIETEIPIKLKKGKNYQIIFIVKNREGSTNSYQIVVEHDLSRNVYKEVGYTVVPIDW